VSVLYGEQPLYVHAKLLAIDAGLPDGRAFVGSENLSDASLLHDRELGIVLVAPDLVDRVDATIAGDLSDGRPWR
jgi:phosphatidylserine/phosphatidylglycerophosphate/cardiolipin synthase-like enzyme